MADNAANLQVASAEMESELSDEFEADCDIEGIVDEIKVPDRFWITMRCWAHTFQLVLIDSVKSSTSISRAFEALKKVVGFFRKKSNYLGLRATVESKQKSGEHCRMIPNPTETRWNSYARYLGSYVELRNERHPNAQCCRHEKIFLFDSS